MARSNAALDRRRLADAGSPHSGACLPVRTARTIFWETLPRCPAPAFRDTRRSDCRSAPCAETPSSPARAATHATPCQPLQHRPPTDIDIFNGLFKGTVGFRDRGLEGIEVDYNHVDGSNSMLLHLRNMGWYRTPSQ